MGQQFAPKSSLGIPLAALILVSLWSGPAAAQESSAEWYENGQNALREANYRAAERAFNEVISAKSSQADAALYWLAYTHYQSGQERLAQKAISRLRADFPKSAWLDDADALELQHGAAPTTARLDAAEDQELRLYALAALMNKHPDRALPLAQKMLGESTDAESREQVLFIIGTNESPQARDIIREIALKGEPADLRQNAIFLLASDATPADLVALSQLYDQVDDQDSKEVLIHAMAGQEQVDWVVKVLAREQSPELQSAAIFALASMEAVDALNRLDLDKLSPDARESAVYAFAQVSEVRPEQLQQLVKMYQDGQDPELKETILYALGSAEQEAHLSRLLAQETEPELQATAIYALASMEARDALLGLNPDRLEAEAREALVHALAQVGESERLIEMLRKEQNPELRANIIYSLSDAKDGAEQNVQLMQIYRQSEGKKSDREAVIFALMNREATRELLQLARQEQDPDLRRTILHALAETDDPEAQEYLFKLLEQ